MMKRTRFLSLTVFALGFMVFSWSLHAKTPEPATTENVIVKTKEGAEFAFNVELATTGSEQSKGLMDRTTLAKDAGMLFVFSDVGRRSFWMKDTLIPLDMLFIDRDGMIEHIHHMAKPQDESRITSEKPFLAVLEINGGMADNLGIHEGDMVIHETFRNAHVE